MNPFKKLFIILLLRVEAELLYLWSTKTHRIFLLKYIDERLEEIINRIESLCKPKQ
jgi:hypothetical protein